MLWVFEVRVKLAAATETQHLNDWRGQNILCGLRVQLVLTASLAGGRCKLIGLSFNPCVHHLFRDLFLKDPDIFCSSVEVTYRCS